MIPFLTYPLALLALASLPALAAIYLFRHRFRRRQVSSLVLWQFRIQSHEGGSRLRRLQLPLLFFLELLALLLLVAAASGPHWKLPQATRPLIVVLDDSLSMRATEDDVAARTRARAFLEKLFRSQPPASIRLVLAGSEPRLLRASARNWTEIDKLLDQWTCWAPSAAIDSAIHLASELGRQQANLLVLTDHPPPDKPAGNRLLWRAFGAASGNIAFVNASRTAYGEQDRCLLEIANNSSRAAAPGLVIRAGSNVVEQSRLSLAPGERQRLVFNLPSSASMLDARLEPDALTEDNHVQLLPPVRKHVRVRVALADPDLARLVDRTLAATGLRAAISEDPELVIHQSESFMPGSNVWSLRWIVPAKPTAYVGPFLIDTDHPLSEGLALEGVVWAAAQTPPQAGAVPVILAGNVPILTAREDVLGRQFLTIDLDPAVSTVQTTPDWPILFWNLLSWRAAELPGLVESNHRLGADVMLNASGEPVKVDCPDGSVKSFPKPGGQLVLQSSVPGLYSVAMGRSTNSFAVNPLAPEESDLSACATGQWGDWSGDAETRWEQKPLAWIFALAALGLLTAHLWFVAAGKGGS